MTITLIETKTVGTATNTLQFTSIPQTYTDLYITLSVRTSIADNIGYTTLRVNNATTNWTTRHMQGNGAAVASSSGTGAPDFFGSGGNTTANTFGNGSVYIPNYTGSANKSLSIDFVSENNASGAFSAMQRIVAALWSNSAAITSFEVVADGVTNLSVGTTVSIYGILKGTDGIVVVS
jgi:hypothetical protein